MQGFGLVLEGISVRPLIIFIILCVFMFAAAHEGIIVRKSELVASSDEWRRETSGMYNAWEAYAAEYYNEFRRQSTVMLESFDRQTQALREKTKETSRKAQEKLARLASEWHTQRIVFDQQLKQIKITSIEGWETFRRYLADRMQELKRFSDRTRSPSP
jgi:hypothetical protein